MPKRNDRYAPVVRPGRVLANTGSKDRRGAVGLVFSLLLFIYHFFVHVGGKAKTFSHPGSSRANAFLADRGHHRHAYERACVGGDRVCVHARAANRVRVCVNACVRVSVRARVCVSVCARARVCVCACIISLIIKPSALLSEMIGFFKIELSLTG